MSESASLLSWAGGGVRILESRDYWYGQSQPRSTTKHQLQDGADVGGSSQSKRFISWPGVDINLVRAAIVDRPLEHIQVTTNGCIPACDSIPRAALAPEPLQDLKVTTVAGTENEGAIQLEPLLSFQPLQDLQMASFRCKAKSKQETSQKRKQRRRRRNCEDEDSPASLATSENTRLVLSDLDFFKGLRSSCSKGRWP